MLFWHEFDFKVCPYFLSNEGIHPVTHNKQEIFSCHRKKHLSTASNFLSQKGISYQGHKFLFKLRNFLSEEAISCHGKKYLVTGRNFLLEAEMSCHRKELFVIRRNLLSQKEKTKFFSQNVGDVQDVLGCR